MILSFLFAVLFVYLEYYYILLDGFPYRNAIEPMLFVFHSYHLFPMIPLLAFIAFQPLIHQYLIGSYSAIVKRGIIILGFANFLLALTVNDLFYFVFRRINPSASDPLAGEWIRQADWTAQILGSIDLFGVVFPTWYLITIIIFVPVYLAFLIAK